MYPGKQIHFAEWYPDSQIALEPQCINLHASTQLPLLHFSDLPQSLSTSHSAFTSTEGKRQNGYIILILYSNDFLKLDKQLNENEKKLLPALQSPWSEKIVPSGHTHATVRVGSVSLTTHLWFPVQGL